MIILAILATIAAPIVSYFIIMANAMSDSPGAPFMGGWILTGMWLAVAVLWLAWGFG